MKWKTWLTLATFVALGVIIFFAWSDIVEAFRRMSELNIWVLSLVVPAILLSFVTLALFYKSFFRAIGNGHQLTSKNLLAAMLEHNFVNHVFPSGGVSGFSYLAFRLRPFGVSTAKSSLAQLARLVLSLVIYVGFMLIGLFWLALEEHTSSLVVLVVSAVVFSLLFGSGVLLFVISHKGRIASFSGVLVRGLNRIIRVVRPKYPEVIKVDRVQETLFELHEDYVLLKQNKQKMRPVIWWALITAFVEILPIYITFVAHGVWINPGAVVIAFVIANIAGLLSILPGGLGTYEPIMVGVLVAVGVPASVALSVTLVYRVIMMLVTLLTGYALYQRAIHKYGTADIHR